MKIACQIILAIILIVTLIGSVGEKKDKDLRRNMTAICITSIVSELITFFVL